MEIHMIKKLCCADHVWISIVLVDEYGKCDCVVYLLEDICRLARQSPEDALHLSDHFVRKLDARSPITKAKVGYGQAPNLRYFAV